MLSSIRQSGLWWSWIAVVGLIADQWTKIWADNALAGGRIIEVLPHFDFRLAYNYGAAFSIFADAGGMQKYFLSIFSILVSIGIMVWLYKLKRQERWLSIALCLVLAGAIGNAIDRVSYGYVVDFIDWYIAKDGYHWPTFNIADAVISAGAVMLIIDSLFFQQPDNAADKQKASSDES